MTKVFLNIMNNYSLRFNPKLGDLEFTYLDSKKK